MKEIQAIVRQLVANDPAPSVLATLVTVEGSSYRRPGARLLIRADGTRVGSISGGCLEEDVLTRARRVAETGAAEAVVYDTTLENDLVWGVGLGCHGVVRVLLERLPARPEWAVRLATSFVQRQPCTLAVRHRGPTGAALGTAIANGAASGPDVLLEAIRPPPHLCIFGAGDDAQPLVRVAKELGWVVTVADPRPAFATPARFPNADAIVIAPSDQLADRIHFDPETLAVVMTHHYVHDVPLLRALLPRDFGYLGLLGPKQRAERILDDLTQAGLAITPQQRARLHAPVGLDLGANTPEQVAVAIVAEIEAVRAGRTGRPLRERTKPIHDV